MVEKNKNDISRLPRWAQALFEAQTNRIQDLQLQLQQAKGELEFKDPRWFYDDQVSRDMEPLGGDRTRVRVFPHGPKPERSFNGLQMYITNDGGLDITSDSGCIAVVPWSTNHVVIYNPDLSDLRKTR